MKRSAGPLLALVSLVSACTVEQKPAPAAPPPKPAAPAAAAPAAPAPAAPAPESPKPSGNAPAPASADMDTAIAALMAKPEQPDERIEIQHVLIAFKGAPRMSGITRTKEEAKVLAEQVYAEAIGGADFDALVKKHTNDSAPGIYPMTKAGRAGMVKGFGDVGFRLKVGEIGVSPWHAQHSPFGWHIIKRLK